MPSRAPVRNENFASSGHTGRVVESRRTLRQHQTSRFAKEKPLSPQAGQSVKFKDKVKAENNIRPPHADLPLEFVMNAKNGLFIQTKSSGDVEQHQVRKCVNKEEELVKYMSKVPGYLQRGEKLQDNVLNFGVLDWGRLEKWTHKQNKISASDRTSRPATGSCSTSTNGSSVASAAAKIEAFPPHREQPTTSHINSCHKVGCSPVIKPLNGKAINHPDLGTSINCFQEEKQIMRKKDEPRFRIVGDLTTGKSKGKYSAQGSSFVKGTPSSNLSNHNHKVLDTSNKKINNSGGKPEKCAETFRGLGFDNPDKKWSEKQESFVLLLPKDFCRAGSSELPPKAAFYGKSAELNWGSFSDIFSVDEIHSDESFSDIPHSCPLPSTVETDTELDLKLDNLIEAQGFELPVNPPDMPLHSNENNMKTEATTIFVEACRGLDQRVPQFADEITRDGTRGQRFSFRIARMTRSLSLKEGSMHPQLSSTYVTAKSGPAKPEGSSGCETLNSNKENANGRTRNSPLRRLLDPLLKARVANRFKEPPNDLKIKPPTGLQVPKNENCEASTIKALLHLTVKSGLPLFKFVVETNNEILASTLKNLSSFGKDDTRWLYTFYSVHKVKKSGGWKNQKVRTCGFDYNVIGQMKVSSPHLPDCCKKKSEGRYMVKESVLYNVDLSKTDAATSEFMASRELAAIVVKMPEETIENGSAFSDSVTNNRFSNLEGDDILGSTVVILPGAIHSLPNEGVPSPLIKRWRSGGSCDCGGWDIGCKLRILTNQVQDCKILMNSRSLLSHVRCDLFDQEEAKQSMPVFSLVPFQDGLFSVEFDTGISSLQAFSTCVAIFNSQSPTYSLDATDQVGPRLEFDRPKASIVIEGEGPEKHAPHPPLSPVGRV